MDGFAIRPAGAADVPVIARHRAEMFTDMGQLPPQLYQALVDETCRFLETTLASGEYVGWMAQVAGDPEVVAGAGVHIRPVMPRVVTHEGDGVLARRRQGIVLNVFTERPWRRRGLAARLMDEVLGWARTADIDTLVLHASDEGKALYERLGFRQTNEMRFSRPLR